MSNMYAMRCANGDWFALDDGGRFRLPVFGSQRGGMLARAVVAFSLTVVFYLLVTAR